MTNENRLTPGAAEAEQANPGATPPEISSQEFAKALRAWRILRGWTQDDLVEKSGVSKSSISLAERASHAFPPKPVTISRLAAAFGVPIGELMRPPPNSHLSTIKSFVTNPAGRSVLRVPARRCADTDPDHITLPAKWALGIADNPGELTTMMVGDQAMLPTIRAGDVAVLEPARNAAPGVYLVAAPDDPENPIGIRRVTPLPGGHLRITCDNERFSGNDAVFQPSEIVLLSKVVFVARCHIMA